MARGDHVQILTVLAIIAGNAITYEVAVSRGWSLGPLLWIFFLQNLVIGFFAFLRLCALQRFSTHGVTVSGKPVEPTAATKRVIAGYFALHYGAFHAFYFAFLAFFALEGKLGPPSTGDDQLWIAVLGGSFFVSHWLAHRQNVASDIRYEHNIGALMFLPYARVLPMHIMIIACGMMADPSALLMFVVMKTIADVVMQLVEHHWSQRDSARSDRMHFGIDED